ncbi:hypothetical protein SAFG77S_11553 [Streptomyces afghaniensis]
MAVICLDIMKIVVGYEDYDFRRKKSPIVTLLMLMLFYIVPNGMGNIYGRTKKTVLICQ